MKRLLIPVFCVTIGMLATADYAFNTHAQDTETVAPPVEAASETAAVAPAPPHVLLTMPTTNGIIKIKASVLATTDGKPNVAAAPLFATDGKVTGCEITSGANGQTYRVAANAAGKLLVETGDNRFTAGNTFEISSKGGIVILALTLDPKVASKTGKVDTPKKDTTPKTAKKEGVGGVASFPEKKPTLRP